MDAVRVRFFSKQHQSQNTLKLLIQRQAAILLQIRWRILSRQGN